MLDKKQFNLLWIILGLAVCVGVTTAISIYYEWSGYLVLLLLAFLVIYAIIQRPYIVLLFFLIILINPFAISDIFSIEVPIFSDNIEFREIFFFLIVIIAFIQQFIKKNNRRRVPLASNLSIFYPTILFSITVMVYFLVGILQRGIGGLILKDALTLGVYILFPFVVINLVRNIHEWKVLVIGAIFLITLSAALSLAQVFIGDKLVLIGARQMKAFQGSYRVYTEIIVLQLMSLGIVFSFLLNQKRISNQLLLIIPIGILILGLATSISRTVIVAIVGMLGAIYLLGFRKKPLASFSVVVILIILGILFLGFLSRQEILSGLYSATTSWFNIFFKFGMQTGSLQNRAAQYQIAIEEIIRNPLGAGLGKNILEGRLVTPTNKIINVHNGYLRIAASIGIIGLGFYLLWIISTLRDTYRFSRIVESNWSPVATGLFWSLVGVWFLNVFVVWGVSTSTILQIGFFVGIVESYIVLKRVESINMLPANSKGFDPNK